MGFNIGVSAIDCNFITTTTCRQFLDRRFYNWVAEFEYLGEKSSIIQTGKYFELDLTPLTKLIYTNGDIDEKYMLSGLQNTDFLIQLIEELLQKIDADRNFYDNLDFEAANKHGNDVLKSLLNKFEQATSLEENFSTEKLWKNYLSQNEFQAHLKALKSSLECYKTNGHSNVFLTAG